MQIPRALGRAPWPPQDSVSNPAGDQPLGASGLSSQTTRPVLIPSTRAVGGQVMPCVLSKPPGSEHCCPRPPMTIYVRRPNTSLFRVPTEPPSSATAVFLWCEGFCTRLALPFMVSLSYSCCAYHGVASSLMGRLIHSSTRLELDKIHTPWNLKQWVTPSPPVFSSLTRVSSPPLVQVAPWHSTLPPGKSIYPRYYPSGRGD